MGEQQSDKRILIVDDDDDMQQLISFLIKKWGYKVIQAVDGEQGIRFAREQKPDLILLDTIMPKENGREVCSTLKSDPDTQRIPIIFLTALQLPDNVRSAMDLGADDYIGKPFDHDELKHRIELCLHRASDSTQA